MIVKLVTALHEHEQRVASTLASGARLQLAAAELQQLSGDRLGYLCGHQFITAITDAQALGGQAMTRIADGHRRLAKIGEAMGYKLDEGAGFGDYAKPPSMARALFEAAALQAGSASAS